MELRHGIAALLLPVLVAAPLSGQVGGDLRAWRLAPSEPELQPAHPELSSASADARLNAVERRLRQAARESEPSLAGHLTAGVLLGAVAGTAVGGWLGYDNEVDGGPATAYGPEVPPDDDFMDEDAWMGGIVGGVIGGGLGVTIYRAKLP